MCSQRGRAGRGHEWMTRGDRCPNRSPRSRSTRRRSSRRVLSSRAGPTPEAILSRTYAALLQDDCVLNNLFRTMRPDPPGLIDGLLASRADPESRRSG